MKGKPRLVFGTVAALEAELARSTASRAVNTSFVERQNGTDRKRNARKAGEVHGFSKLWDVHESIPYFRIYTCNFCCPARTLSTRDATGRIRARTPTIAAGLADHVWSLSEWLTLPSVPRK